VKELQGYAPRGIRFATEAAGSLNPIDKGDRTPVNARGRWDAWSCSDFESHVWGAVLGDFKPRAVVAYGIKRPTSTSGLFMPSIVENGVDDLARTGCRSKKHQKAEANVFSLLFSVTQI